MNQDCIPFDERKITDEDVLSAFDYSYPGLEKAGASFREGRIEEAKQEIVEYFRTRRNVTHYYDFREKTDPIPSDILTTTSRHPLASTATSRNSALQQEGR